MYKEEPTAINIEEEDLFNDVIGSGMMEAMPDTAIGPN
jgi:hypothetical protein